MMRGLRLTSFNLVDLSEGISRNPDKGATRRECATAALIRHRERERKPPVGAPDADQWNAYILWVAAWEDEIIRYRDGKKESEHE